ncbi:MAG: YitT family protein [Clostridia bacterium]|nr:YitT family protein [Clostridia bacterium]
MERNFTKAVLILTGALVAGLGINMFLEPIGIAPGGISGIAVVISYIFRGKLPVGVLTFILNLPLFIIGYKYIGRQFILKSVIGTALFSFMLDLTSSFGNLLKGDNKLLYALWGGAAIGCGLGMIFRGGASTGGTDIIARLMQKKINMMTMGKAVLWLDFIFLAIVAFVYKSIEAALYTGVAVFVASKVVDTIESGINYAKEVVVFTEQPEEMSKEIINRLRRGVSVIEAKGMYSKQKKYMVVCVVYNRQVTDLRKIVNKYDSNAFVIIKEVRETTGLID